MATPSRQQKARQLARNLKTLAVNGRVEVDVVNGEVYSKDAIAKLRGLIGASGPEADAEAAKLLSQIAIAEALQND